MVKFILESRGVKITLPINPEVLSRPRESNNTVVNVVGEGDIIIPGSVKLTERVIESYFPAHKPYWMSPKDFMSPVKYTNIITGWQKNNNIILLTITGLNHTSIKTIINRFNTERRGGEHEDIYYTLELSEYRPYGAVLLKAKDNNTYSPPPPQRADINKPVVNSHYDVVKGDCLWSIAQNLCGDGSRWREMFDINRSIIGGDQVIYVGNRLKVPESWITS